jgi:hypothetical protein
MSLTNAYIHLDWLMFELMKTAYANKLVNVVHEKVA